MFREIEVFLLPDGRMDAQNAAIYVGLSTKTLAMMRSEGRGPHFLKRGRISYYKEDLDEWLRGGRAGSTAEVRLSASVIPAIRPVAKDLAAETKLKADRLRPPTDTETSGRSAITPDSAQRS